MGSSSGLGVTLALSATPVRKIIASELPSDITELSAVRLSAAIRNGEVSCVEVMQAYLKQIHRYNPVYNAIVSMVEDDSLLDQARDADRALA